MENKSPSRSQGGWLLPASAAVLIFNSAYVAAFGNPTLFYVANALLHPRVAHTLSLMYAPHGHAPHLCHRVLSMACPGFSTVPRGGMSAPPVDPNQRFLAASEAPPFQSHGKDSGLETIESGGHVKLFAKCAILTSVHSRGNLSFRSGLKPL